MADLLSRIFALSDELLCAINVEGYIVDLTPAWEPLLGLTRDELRAEPFTLLVHPDDRDATTAAAARLGGGSDLVRFHNRFRRSDGSYVALEWSAVAPQSVSEPICARARPLAPSEPDLRDLRMEALSAAMSTPIIQLWDEIVTMPVVGLVDSVRAADMKSALLAAVSRTEAKFAIVDLTGVDTVDTATADHLLRVMRAVQLLGARCVITGIQPSVAQIIIGLGLDLPGITTLRTLREGLRFCLRRLGIHVTRAPANPRDPA